MSTTNLENLAAREKSRACHSYHCRPASHNAGANAFITLLNCLKIPPRNQWSFLSIKRFALLRFPYSDLRSLPRGLPFLVRYNTVISVPLEVITFQNHINYQELKTGKPMEEMEIFFCQMRELLRQIQRVEQLSPAIHWHGNLSDSDMGRDLLVKNNSITKNS